MEEMNFQSPSDLKTLNQPCINEQTAEEQIYQEILYLIEEGQEDQFLEFQNNFSTESMNAETGKRFYQLLKQKATTREVTMCDIYQIFSQCERIPFLKIEENQKQCIISIFSGNEVPEQDQEFQSPLVDEKIQEIQPDPQLKKDQIDFDVSIIPLKNASQDSLTDIEEAYVELGQDQEIDHFQDEKNKKESPSAVKKTVSQEESIFEEIKSQSDISKPCLKQQYQSLQHEYVPQQQVNQEQYNFSNTVNEHLQRELTDIFQNSILNQQEEKIMEEKLIDRAFSIINSFQKEKFSHEKLTPHIFGSYYIGIQMKNSDIDILIEKQNIESHEYVKNIMNKLYYYLLERSKEKQVKNNSFFNQSLVTYYNSKYKTSIDFVMGDMHGMYNSNLIQKYLEISPQVRKLIVLVLRWAKANQIIDKNKLSSFFFYNLIIAFLQHNQLLPYLQKLECQNQSNKPIFTSVSENQTHDGYFEDNLELIQIHMAENQFKDISKIGVFYLLRKFFRFAEFLIKESFEGKFYQISIKHGIYIQQQKQMVDQGSQANFKFMINVYDPFDWNKNLSYRYISEESQRRIKTVFLSAPIILEQIQIGEDKLSSFFQQLDA